MKFRLGIVHIISLILLLLIPLASASPDSLEKSPSAYEDSDWFLEDYAYVSDDARAFTLYDGDQVTYLNFSFEDSLPSSCTIDSVVVKAEGYVSYIVQSLVGRVTWDGGTTWGSGQDFAFPTRIEANKTIDVTTDTAWTRNKLTNENFKVQLMYLDEPLGCFTNQTYFITWNETAHMKADIPYQMKNIDKAKVGDMILCSNHKEGIHWDRIASVTRHFGNWTIIDIWSGNVTIHYQDIAKTNRTYVWHHHGQVTDNHESLIYRNGSWHTIPARYIKIGDETQHLCHEEIALGPNDYVPLEDHYLKSERIYRIDQFNMTGIVYDIRTTDDLDHLFMTFISEKEMKILLTLQDKYDVNLESYIDPQFNQKWTVYLDCLTVQVSYTPISGEWHEVECWYGQLITRSWSLIEIWYGDLEGFSALPLLIVPVIMVSAVAIIYFMKYRR